MIPYSKAFPHAEASGRLCPFPSHFLVALDEVRTLLRKKGWSPRTATAPPRTATKEEIASPSVRTYQLITQTEATPRDFVGIGCRFLLGRTYCFGEQVEEEEANPDLLTTDKETQSAPPWRRQAVEVDASCSKFTCECGDTIPLGRVQLNYRTCLTCGEREARLVTYPSAPINKSNYMLITHPSQLKQLNPKNSHNTH